MEQRMTTLSDLVARLQSDVPAVNGVPSTAQYQQAVKDAVADFSRRSGRIKISTLNIVSGTASYTLPDDFQKMIELLTFHYSGTLVTEDGLIPINPNFYTKEKTTIFNKTITFYPTPAYTMDRDFRYKAGWVLSTDEFLEMSDLEDAIVILKAKALAFSKQANSLSSGMNKYSFGAVSVDKSDGGSEKRSSAETNEKDYLAAVERYNGSYFAVG